VAVRLLASGAAKALVGSAAAASNSSPTSEQAEGRVRGAGARRTRAEPSQAWLTYAGSEAAPTAPTGTKASDIHRCEALDHRREDQVRRPTSPCVWCTTDCARQRRLATSARRSGISRRSSRPPGRRGSSRLLRRAAVSTTIDRSADRSDIQAGRRTLALEMQLTVRRRRLFGRPAG
jgi:hypothetical protein